MHCMYEWNITKTNSCVHLNVIDIAALANNFLNIFFKVVSLYPCNHLEITKCHGWLGKTPSSYCILVYCAEWPLWAGTVWRVEKGGPSGGFLWCAAWCSCANTGAWGLQETPESSKHLFFSFLFFFCCHSFSVRDADSVSELSHWHYCHFYCVRLVTTSLLKAVNKNLIFFFFFLLLLLFFAHQSIQTLEI